jgi:hypothetical protein
MNAVIKLSTGRELHATGGVVGISLTGRGEEAASVYDGYDGHLSTYSEGVESMVSLTGAERRELAALMVERWHKWGMGK